MPIRFPYSSALLPLLLVAGAGTLTAQSDLNVPPGNSLTLNESAAYQNVTVGGGAILKTIDANSGGAGDHAITITFAAYAAGTIQNDGLIQLAGNDQGNTTVFANPVTISGSGTLELLNTTRFSDANVHGPGTVTQAAGHTLIGGGGDPNGSGSSFSAPLVNYGLVTTSRPGFHLDGASLVNRGTFSASGGSTLSLDAPTLDNTSGTITAADTTSRVDLHNVTITGGTLSSVNSTGSSVDQGGFFYNAATATLDNVTFAAGSVFRGDNPIAIAGTLTNNGYFQLGGYNFNTRLTGGLSLVADATLAGTGSVQLAGGEIDATNNATLTVAAGATVSAGSGTINASVVNNGTVESTYQGLVINSPIFSNTGLLAAANNANVSVSSATNFTNYHTGTQTLSGGTYAVTDEGNGATLDFGGRSVLVNAATITLSGPNSNFSAISGLATNEGTLSLLALKQFTTTSRLVNAGTITLDAGTTLSVGGNFTGKASSSLSVVIGGIHKAGLHSPGVLQANGAATLAGDLSLAFAKNAFLPAENQTVTILSANSPLKGSFANVASGGRLHTTDGTGSFRVNYGEGTDTVVLADFLRPGQKEPKPTVTLHARVPLVTAKSGNDGEFLLRLSPAPRSDLTVKFTIKGSAIDGTDYALLTDTVVIKAGMTSKPIRISPRGDLDGAKEKTVVLTLRPGSGYEVGHAEKATVTIKAP